jgi:hypothetical protein
MESRRCAPHSALVLVAAQRAWAGAEWQRLQGLLRGAGAGEQGAARARGGGRQRGSAAAAAAEDASEVLAALRAAGAAVQSGAFLVSGLPGVHVALRLPATVDSSLLPGVERLPQLYLDAEPPWALAQGCPLARCIGLQQWIEGVLVEAGVRTLVVGGATQSGLVHRMARALQERYGARDAAKRLRRVGGKGRALPRLRVVVDRRLCGDFAAMREPACAECLAQWRRRGYSPPTGPRCAHAAEAAARPHSAVGASEAELHALGVRFCDGFEWGRLRGWTDAELAALAERRARRAARKDAQEARLAERAAEATGGSHGGAAHDPAHAEESDSSSEGGMRRSVDDDVDNEDDDPNDQEDVEAAYANQDGAATWLEASAGLDSVSGWLWAGGDDGTDGEAARLVLERIERREMCEAEREGRRIAAAVEHVRTQVRDNALRSARANMLVEDIESTAAREAVRLARHLHDASAQVDRRRGALVSFLECERFVDDLVSRVAPAPVDSSRAADDSGALALAAERDLDALLARLAAHDLRARGVAEPLVKGVISGRVVVPGFLRAHRDDDLGDEDELVTRLGAAPVQEVAAARASQEAQLSDAVEPA